MNATLLHTPRALAAAVAALVLALAAALVAPTIAGDLDARFDNRPAASQTSATQPDALAPATWARTPLASPLETLREVPR
jgi:hypothetical protein